MNDSEALLPFGLPDSGPHWAGPVNRPEIVRDVEEKPPTVDLPSSPQGASYRKGNCRTEPRRGACDEDQACGGNVDKNITPFCSWDQGFSWTEGGLKVEGFRLHSQEELEPELGGVYLEADPIFTSNGVSCNPRPVQTDEPMNVFELSKALSKDKRIPGRGKNVADVLDKRLTGSPSRLHWRGLRTSAATEPLHLGIPVPVICRLLRHVNVLTTTCTWG